MQRFASRHAKAPNLTHIGSNNALHYTSRRGGAISNFFTNKLSLGYKIRGVKSREDFKPKGILVYKSTYIGKFKYLAAGTAMFATSFTCAGIYDYIYPIEYFAQNFLVMFVGGCAAWMIPLFIIPSFGRRFITRMWLEGNWWIHLESHSRFGKIRHTRVPIGFARVPNQQFQTIKGLRKYMMGVKIYNEWGYYYLRRNGRFCDAKALQVMFGDDVMATLEEQKLIKPIVLPPEVMDDTLFPPTEYKEIQAFEAARAKYSPMPMEEGFFAKFNIWRIWRQRMKEKKEWKRKQMLLQQWRNEGKSEEQIILLLDEQKLLDTQDRSQLIKEEFADLSKKKQLLKHHPVFEKLQREQPDLYSKFKDLEWFTAREIGIMKEFGQIGLVEMDAFGKIVIDYKNDPLLVNENGVPRGIPPQKSKFPDYVNMTQEELHEIYEGEHPITVPKKGNFLRMKPEKEAEKHRATAMRFIEWKRDLDERANKQIKKMKEREKLEKSGKRIESQQVGKKTGYAMSAHAIEQKYEREGLILTKFEINREHKKKGIKYWKRYMGNTFRPRRSSTKRWNHMWDKRMVFDKKVKRRGRYLSKSIKGT